MDKHFIPLEYLNEKERELFDQTKKLAKAYQDIETDKYFELVLETLLHNSVERSKQDKNENYP